DTISSHGGSDTTRTRSSDVWAPPWSALSRTSSDSYSSKPARLHIGVADAKIAGEWTGVASRPARCSHTVTRNWWLPRTTLTWLPGQESLQGRASALAQPRRKTRRPGQDPSTEGMSLMCGRV